MTISPISPTSVALNKANGAAAPRSTFATVQREAQRISNELPSLAVPQSLMNLQRRILAGGELKPSELLSAQIAMHQFNLKVELVGKGVESLTSSVKRLQQQQ